MKYEVHDKNVQLIMSVDGSGQNKLNLIYLIYMGAALGCSCETKDDQAEISLV
jgi:hypothetical protein